MCEMVGGYIKDDQINIFEDENFGFRPQPKI